MSEDHEKHEPPTAPTPETPPASGTADAPGSEAPPVRVGEDEEGEGDKQD